MIDWKSRISNSLTHIDLNGLPYYTMKFSGKSKIQTVYEVDCILPEEPEDQLCINYGLNEFDQIFRRTSIPKQIKNPDQDYGKENWSRKDKEAFIDAEWNRRRNGVWIFIKGKKFYITGPLYVYLNYWKSLTGQELIYKFSDLEFFVFIFHCLLDPKCFGIVDFKCRQAGDTEKVVFLMWEYGSRVRGTLNGMQSCINEGHAKKSYYRLVHGHKNMIYYFRPLNQGTEDPKKGLNLSYPSQYITYSNIKDKNKKGEIVNRSSSDDYEYPEINSQFYYGPSKVSEFDGTTLGRAYLDEFGKPSQGSINPVEWIQVIREAIESRILNKKMGFIFMTSTVEDIGANSLDWALTIWNEADPSKRTSEGKTTNGLYRCFRNVVDRGEVDRWGFPLKEKILAEIKSQIDSMMAAGNIRGVISYRRKNCITIDDVFKGAHDNSQFDVEKLEKRFHYICNVSEKKLWTRGNLKWANNQRDTQVIWEPNPNGKWDISKHPADLNMKPNAKVVGVHAPKPANTGKFCMGVDPFDQKSTMESEHKRSKAGMVVMRILDEHIDGGPDRYWQFDDPARGIRHGEPVNDGEDFITNRYVCDYLARPDDPSEFFEDCILTFVYYGTDYLPEKNKSGALQTYVESRGYGLYLMERPTLSRNIVGKTNIERDGITATEGSIDEYFSLLTTRSAKWAGTIDHPRILEQFLSGNYQNRGTKDLLVAAGWCEKAATIPRSSYRQQEQSKIRHFTPNYV